MLLHYSLLVQLAYNCLLRVLFRLRLESRNFTDVDVCFLS